MIKNNLKNNKAITLIALIITVIVLLIIAGITISFITGDNGILNKANNASVLYNEAQVKEELMLAISELRMDNSSLNMDIIKNNLKDKLSDINWRNIDSNEPEGEYHGYNFKISENLNVVIFGKSSENESLNSIQIWFGKANISYLSEYENLSNIPSESLVSLFSSDVANTYLLSSRELMTNVLDNQNTLNKLKDNRQIFNKVLDDSEYYTLAMQHLDNVATTIPRLTSNSSSSATIGIADQSSYWAGDSNLAWKAFDNDTTTNTSTWLSNTGYNTNQWLSFKYNKEISIYKFKMCPQNFDCPNRYPASFKLQYYNKNTLTWETAQSYTASTATSMTFIEYNNTANWYTYSSDQWRIFVNNAIGGSYIGIGELQLYGIYN